MTEDEPDTLALLVAANHLCTLPSCNERHEAKGYCAGHYRRFRRHGDPEGGRKDDRTRAPIGTRLARGLVETESGCLEWRGAQYFNGYGSIRSGEPPYRARYTHRVAWEDANGPIPDGMLVCHTCDNRVCCNPDHLFLGTHADNMRDMTEKSRQARGTQNAHSKITDDQVRAIRRRREEGATFVAIAKDVGIAESGVRQICKRERWTHVKESA